MDEIPSAAVRDHVQSLDFAYDADQFYDDLRAAKEEVLATFDNPKAVALKRQELKDGYTYPIIEQLFDPLERDGDGRISVLWEEFAQEYGDDVVETVYEAYNAWVELNAPYNFDTAPIWQAAVADTGNYCMPSPWGYRHGELNKALKADVSADEMRAVELYKEYNQAVLEELVGDTVPLFRGIMKFDPEQDGDDITLDHRPLEPWSLYENDVANFFAENGVILRKEIPVDDIWYAYITQPPMRRMGNGPGDAEFVVAHDGPDTYTWGDTIVREPRAPLQYRLHPDNVQYNPKEHAEWVLDTIEDR